MIGLRLLLFASFLKLALSRSYAPSFSWNIRNEIFKNNTNKLCRKPGHIFLNYDTQMFFLCPHVILKVAQSTSRLDSNKVYENIHMVTRAGFDSCTVDLPNSLLLKCDRGLRASRIKFEQVTFNIFNFNGWSFMPGNTYYFINTGNGTKEGLNSKSGGRCLTHNMKLKITVCPESDTCNSCEDMCCEKPPTTQPPTTTPTTTPTTIQTTVQTTQTLPKSLVIQQEKDRPKPEDEEKSKQERTDVEVRVSKPTPTTVTKQKPVITTTIPANEGKYEKQHKEFTKTSPRLTSSTVLITVETISAKNQKNTMNGSCQSSKSFETLFYISLTIILLLCLLCCLYLLRKKIKRCLGTQKSRDSKRSMLRPCSESSAETKLSINSQTLYTHLVKPNENKRQISTSSDESGKSTSTCVTEVYVDNGVEV